MPWGKTDLFPGLKPGLILFSFSYFLLEITVEKIISSGLESFLSLATDLSGDSVILGTF